MKSRTCSVKPFGILFLLAALTHGTCTFAQDGDRQVKVPIVMEEATVRGKVAVLESTREERRVIGGLKINVWSTKESKETSNRRWGRKTETRLERDTLLKETTTDDLGLFNLPKLDVGEYLLDVSDVEFRLTVIPQSSERAGQTEPKVLLILIPKEVVTINPEQTQEQEVANEVSAPSADSAPAKDAAKSGGEAANSGATAEPGAAEPAAAKP